MPAFTDPVVAPAGVVGQLTGNVVGNVAGQVVGNLTGTVTGNVVGNVTGNLVGGVIPINQLLTGDGAIAIPAGNAVVVLTKGSAAAITIAPPVAGTDDWKEITVISTTAFAHVITQGTVGFNAKAASGTATYAANKGSSCKLTAYQGNWYVSALNGVTIA